MSSALSTFRGMFPTYSLLAASDDASVVAVAVAEASCARAEILRDFLGFWNEKERRKTSELWKEDDLRGRGDGLGAFVRIFAGCLRRGEGSREEIAAISVEN